MSTIKTSKIQPPSDSDPLVLSTNAAERMRIDTAGNVGIGTAPTSYKFTVGGSSPQFSVIDSGANLSRALITVTPGGVSFGNTYHTTAIPIAFNIGVTEVARFNTSGNMGIGTASPVAKLDVRGTVSISDTGIFPTSSGGFAYNRILVGGTGAAIFLWDNGSTVAAGRYARLGLGSRNATSSTMIAGGYIDGGNEGTADHTGYLAFYTTPADGSSNVERMRINSSGSVGIGTASPSVALDVAGQIKSSSGLTVTSGSVSLPTTSLSGDALTTGSVSLSKLATIVLGAASVSSTLNVQTTADQTKSLAIGEWTAMKVTSGLTIGVAGHTWFVIFVRNNTDSQLGVYKFTGPITVSTLCNAVNMPVSTLYLIACRVA